MLMTLLDMTQSILSALGSDPVNSISDTVESLQVAECLRTTYYNMLGRYDLPEHNQLIQLISSGSSQQPTLMTMPTGISRIERVEYYDTNPQDSQGIQQDQFGAYSHDLNLDLQQNPQGWVTTSSSTVTIGLGTATFTVPTGLTIIPGQSAYMYSGNPASGANSMVGVVLTYTGTTLTIQVNAAFGSGTFSAWTISQFSESAFGPGYLFVNMIPIDSWFSMTDSFDLTEVNIGAFTLTINDNATGVPQNFVIKFRNDKQPQYCCVLSNQYVLFDSYDSSQDTTLQTTKTKVMAWSVPSWSMTDTFIPNINEQHFPLMLNDAKSLAFNELKQIPHQKAEEEVARQLVSLQKWKAISGKPSYFQELPDFGRRGAFIYPFKSIYGEWR